MQFDDLPVTRLLVETVDIDRRPRPGRKQFVQSGAGQHCRNIRILEQIAVPCLRVGGIEWQVGGARPVAADEARDHRDRAVEE